MCTVFGGSLSMHAMPERELAARIAMRSSAGRHHFMCTHTHTHTHTLTHTLTHTHTRTRLQRWVPLGGLHGKEASCFQLSLKGTCRDLIQYTSTDSTAHGYTFTVNCKYV